MSPARIAASKESKRPARKAATRANEKLGPESKKFRCEDSVPAQYTLDPEALARRLEQLRDRIPTASTSSNIAVELRGFDANEASDLSLDDFARKRQEILQQTRHPEHMDESGKTALNVDNAAIAGAKMVVDNGRGTRSLTKKLAIESGISEDDVLYKGVPFEGPEFHAARQVKEHREASLLESFVDFKKQMDFKINILKHIENTQKSAANKKQHISFSDGRVTRGQIEKAKLRTEQEKTQQKKNMKKKSGVNSKGKKAEEEELPPEMRTPPQQRKVNPLDDKLIYDKFASVLASGILEDARRNSKIRRSEPIPFRLDLLDTDEEDE